jgi:hypothetical protein
VRPTPLVAFVLVVALVATGCASGGESSKAEHSGTEWVNAVCTDLRRWLDTVTPLRPGSATEDATVTASARQLQLDIDALEPPKTDDGNPAQGEVDRLAEGITAQAGHEPIADLVKAVRGSVDGIRNLTPGGVLETQFARAPACRAVRG